MVSVLGRISVPVRIYKSICLREKSYIQKLLRILLSMFFIIDIFPSSLPGLRYLQKSDFALSSNHFFYEYLEICANYKKVSTMKNVEPKILYNFRV